MKPLMLLISSVALLLFLVNWAAACTIIAVGNKATADGSTIVVHTDDSGGTTTDLRPVRVPAKDWPEGSKRPIYQFQAIYPRLVTSSRGEGYKPVGNQTESAILGYIPQVRHTYAYWDLDYGIMNEHQVMIAESTTSGKTVGYSLAVPEIGHNLFQIGELSKVALERCRTARCAVELMGKLSTEYGFYSDDLGPNYDKPILAGASETLAVADPDEVWIMHMLCGPDRSRPGSVWVAQRVDDDKVAAIGNGIIIRQINLKDKSRYLASANVHSVAIEKGWWNPKEGPFDFTAAYSFDGSFDTNSEWYPLYTGRRQWRVFNMLAPSLKFDPRLGSVTTRPSYPFAVRPDKLITLSDIKRVLRDHYEGTQFDMRKGLAAGPFGNPIRWDPITDYNGVRGGWERPISMFRTSFSFISTARRHLPNEIGGLVWYGEDSAVGTLYIPLLYASTAKVPASYINCLQSEFSTDCAWWAFNLVNNWIQLRYDAMIEEVRAEQERLEGESEKFQKSLEAKALKLCHNKRCPREAVELLEKATVEHAEYNVEQWWNLAWHLVAKYANGFITNGEGAIEKPGYPREWLEMTEFSKYPGNTFIEPPGFPQHFSISSFAQTAGAQQWGVVVLFTVAFLATVIGVTYHRRHNNYNNLV
eukprot:NODE_560_length_2101_cov_43.198830_g516_i0.p1 GENE.NODE_560_length_2101_cov_43.198830_g516_i0~~NODE_560_length_2101_cov_43.198830_g516_i0.p1  ORF type:complete len:643 (-),score=123.24 NODE_560_length_2101_cov_43.198830_g516_i0:113-2041(-)